MKAAYLRGFLIFAGGVLAFLRPKLNVGFDHLFEGLTVGDFVDALVKGGALLYVWIDNSYQKAKESAVSIPLTPYRGDKELVMPPTGEADVGPV